MSPAPSGELRRRWSDSERGSAVDAAAMVLPSGQPVATMRLPAQIQAPGLLVGWSLEFNHRRQPIGFNYGDPDTSPESGYLDPILMESDGHLITIAPTGAGKGVGCIVPALLRYPGPVIVIDPKGENVAITARRRRELGHEVIVLDPIGITSQPAATLNPLDMLDPAAATTVDEAASLATIMVGHQADDRNRFWYDRAAHLLTGVILHALNDHPESERNLPGVRSLINQAAADPAKLMAAMNESVHPEVRAVAQSIAVGAPETVGSIVSVAQDGVDFLRGPLVQDATRTTSFDLTAVTLGKPLSIYVVLPPHMLESHGKLLRLWVTALIMAITRRRSRARQATLFLLDEAAQLGSLPQLRQAITLLRGYGLRTWSFWQDLSQLTLLYPADWQTMVNNCQVVQCFGAFNALASDGIVTLTGFGPASAVLDLGEQEMILQTRGDEPVIARLPNYRFDEPFQGLFDPNPFFAADQEILPKAAPRIRLFQRPAPPKPEPAAPAAATTLSALLERQGPNSIQGIDVISRPGPKDDPLLRRLLDGWPAETTGAAGS